uniref:Uncharacterized protein n=1 Tax=Seriola lalandi dorsalis TaxID=1841481 RepID=A0A3B4YCP6_SERLL
MLKCPNLHDVLEDSLHTTIRMIMLLHTVTTVRAVHLVLKMWNIRSLDPRQTCVNMHHLTFPAVSGVIFQVKWRSRLWIYCQAVQT